MNNRSVLFLLGIARKSGILVPGQDRVLEALKSRKKFLVLMTSDRSDAVASSVGRLVSLGHIVVQLPFIDRKSLGTAIGLNSCQIVALPQKEGLTEAVTRQLSEGGKAVE